MSGRHWFLEYSSSSSLKSRSSGLHFRFSFWMCPRHFTMGCLPRKVHWVCTSQFWLPRRRICVLGLSEGGTDLLPCSITFKYLLQGSQNEALHPFNSPVLPQLSSSNGWWLWISSLMNHCSSAPPIFTKFYGNMGTTNNTPVLHEWKVPCNDDRRFTRKYTRGVVQSSIVHEVVG